jgi:hypothetical protein
MRPLVTLFLLVVLSISTLGCHKETEQDKVKKVITDIQKAAEDKNVKKIINNFSKTYSDPQGYNYETIKGLLLGYFFRHPTIFVYITNLEISVSDTFAKVVFQAVLTGGSKAASAADLIPESLGIYAFVVEMKKESDGWKVTSATWVRVGEGEGKETGEPDQKLLTLYTSYVIKKTYIEYDHIQAKGIPFKSGADPPL